MVSDVCLKELSSVLCNDFSIALMELIVIASVLWGNQWSRKKIMVFGDNESTVHIIDKGCSSVPSINRLMSLTTLLVVHGWVILLSKQPTYRVNTIFWFSAAHYIKII